MTLSDTTEDRVRRTKSKPSPFENESPSKQQKRNLEYRFLLYQFSICCVHSEFSLVILNLNPTDTSSLPAGRMFSFISREHCGDYARRECREKLLSEGPILLCFITQ